MDCVRSIDDFQSTVAGAILDSMPDGVYVTDRNRRIIAWNKAAEKITGWTRTDAINRECRDNFLCHIDKDGHALCGKEHCPLHRAMITNSASDVPRLLFARHRNGSRVPVEVTVSPIIDCDMQVIGGVEVFRDLSIGFEELNRAQAIQRSTLAEKPVEDPRFRIAFRYAPVEMVGGDFYHVTQLDPHRFAVILADVTGHGVSAALYAMQLRALWTNATRHHDHVQELMGALNRRISELFGSEGEYFATAVHLVYDARSGVITYANAGHPPPLLVRKGDGLEELSEHGTALGMVPEAIYPVGQAHLDPGDTLLLYTDGAREIMGHQHQEISEPFFLKTVRERDYADGEEALVKLEESLLRSCRDISFQDDLTLISLFRLA